jgi:hypothetical protein
MKIHYWPSANESVDGVCTFPRGLEGSYFTHVLLKKNDDALCCMALLLQHGIFM